MSLLFDPATTYPFSLTNWPPPPGFIWYRQNRGSSLIAYAPGEWRKNVLSVICSWLSFGSFMMIAITCISRIELLACWMCGAAFCARGVRQASRSLVWILRLHSVYLNIPVLLMTKLSLWSSGQSVSEEDRDIMPTLPILRLNHQDLGFTHQLTVLHIF